MFPFKQVIILIVISVIFLLVSYHRTETRTQSPKPLLNNLENSSWETYGDFYFYFKYPSNWKAKQITDSSWSREVEFADESRIYLKLFYFDNSLSTYLSSNDFIRKNYSVKEKSHNPPMTHLATKSLTLLLILKRSKIPWSRK